MSNFDVYIVHGEPQEKDKAEAWQTAIGLQAVDGLKVSSYLLETARRHIEGDITIDEARKLIKNYYGTKSEHDTTDEENDKASVNIAKILGEPSFSFSLIGLTSIHRRVNVSPTTYYIKKFLRNLILDENNELRNREMLVGTHHLPHKIQSINPSSPKYQFDTLKCTMEELPVLKLT